MNIANTWSRKLQPKLQEHLEFKEFTILTGARQTGKSTLLDSLHTHLLHLGEQSFLLSFEDPQLLHSINEHPENIFNSIPRPTDKRIYLLIDEVQYAANPSNFLKFLYDKYAPKLKIIATGSSAFYIDEKFQDSLAGRKQIFELYTLDFEEFIDFKTSDKQLLSELFEIRSNTSYRSYRRPELETLFKEYITYGGYPAVVLASTDNRKKTILKELVNTYVKRDIYESRIHDEFKFFNLMTILAHQTGSLMNTSELANTLKISSTAIENYLYVLRKTYHLTILNPFYGNIRKELTKMPKIYFNDLGIRNTLLNQFQPIEQRIDRGQVIENFTYIRLRQLYGIDALRFWRTADGNEVDFIITTAYNEGLSVEVKYNFDEFKPSKYKKFVDNYSNYPLQCWAFEAETNRNSILSK